MSQILPTSGQIERKERLKTQYGLADETTTDEEEAEDRRQENLLAQGTPDAARCFTLLEPGPDTSFSYQHTITARSSPCQNDQTVSQSR